RGDPYPKQVGRTTQLLLERLQWPSGRWTQSFQSLFGKDLWLQPYTDETLKQLAGRGVKRVFIATPGFTTDCLKPIDESGYEAPELSQHAGGEYLHRCRCLNDHPAWIEGMRRLILDAGAGWMDLPG